MFKISNIINHITKLCLLAGLFTATCSLNAQTTAVKKATKAVVSITTFDNKGNVLKTSRGFFTGKGTVVSAWTPFVGASKAVVIDAAGHKYNVKSMKGASELYNLCKFNIDASAEGLPNAVTAAQAGSSAWLAGYSTKKPDVVKVDIKSEELFDSIYHYYLLSTECDDSYIGCPVVNNEGKVLGMLQQSPVTLQYNVIDVASTDRFKINGFTINDPVLKLCNIPTELPDNVNEALVTLALATGKDSTLSMQYVNNFIEKFPHQADGYVTKAQLLTADSMFSDADNMLQTAVKMADKKDEAHSAYAKLIYQKLVYMPKPEYKDWTFDKALDEATEAYKINALPLYQHQQAQILYAQQKYADALTLFEALQHTNLRSGEVFYESAQCKMQLKKPQTEILACLDSAVNAENKTSVAPFILARGQYLQQMAKYKEALNDYIAYDSLVYGRGSDAFYYLKFQCEMQLHRYQQALNDIAHAIVINRAEPVYYAEMASLQLRVNMLSDAVKTADLGLRVSDTNADLYIIKGIALCELKQKSAGLEALQKAKSLNDSRAEGLIKKYQ